MALKCSILIKDAKMMKTGDVHESHKKINSIREILQPLSSQLRPARAALFQTSSELSMDSIWS